MEQSSALTMATCAYQKSIILDAASQTDAGVAIVQVVYCPKKPLGMPTLHALVDRLIREQPTLRTSFDCANILSPTAALHEVVCAPVASLAHPGEPPDLAEQLERFLQDDRLNPFDLAKPPLFRITVLCPGTARETIVWTSHAALLDLDSIEELFAFFESGLPPGLSAQSAPAERPVPPAPSDRDLEVFWRGVLEPWVATSPMLQSQSSGSDAAQPLRTVRSPWSRVTLSQLEDFARTQALPVPTLIEASWALFLGQIGATDQPTYGAWLEKPQQRSPSLGIGGNLIPRRAFLEGSTALSDWLKRFQTEREAARVHQNVAVAELRSWSALKPGDPLFTTTVRSVGRREGRAPGQTPTLDVRVSPRVWLAGTAWLNAGSLALSYDPCRVSGALAQVWLELWEHALALIVCRSQVSLADLDWMDTPSARLIELRWNQTARSPAAGSPQTIVEQVRPAFTAHASAVAVVNGTRRMTYAELDRVSTALALHLRASGVGPGDRIAVSLPRGLALPAAVLAILRTGAAYVPIDPAYPPERRRVMLEQAQPKCVIAGEDWTECSCPCLRLAVDDPTQSVAAASITPLPEGLSQPDAPAYIIFTSGSTGLPKGVTMPHRALVNLIAWQAAESQALPPDARTLQFASLSFDVSFQEIFSTWAMGGTLVMIDEETRRDPAALWHAIETHGIHRVFLPFVALQQLAEESVRRKTLPACLREVITAGEQLVVSSQIQSMFTRLTSCALINQYGPSESHVVSQFRLSGPSDSWPLLPPIGSPIANSTIHILDPQRRAVPPGVAGELYLGGTCLATGYLHRPELTEERFVQVAARPRNTQRLYRTGDLGRWLSDGNIEYLGRTDHQVKIRGYRIEVAEVEATLNQHPSVQNSVVHPTGDGAGRMLAAYVVATGERSSLTETLRTHLRQRLPDYMVPGVFVFLDRLPLTPSGKVDRRQLPSPGHLAFGTGTAPTGVRPRNATEQTLCALWTEILPTGNFGVTDRFFDCGGTSLLAVRLHRRLEETLGHKVPIIVILQNPSIESLARALQTDDEPATRAPNSSLAERAARQRDALTRRRQASHSHRAA